MQSLDFTQRIYELDGSPAQTGGEQCPKCGHITNAQPLTLAVVVSRALNVQGREVPQDLSKEERGLLALMVYTATEPLDLKAEQVAGIKKLVDMIWPPVTVAQAFKLLEGEKNPYAPENR
jgi:hypothetical protein